MGFPGSSDGKESSCNAGDPSSIPGLGRFTGEGTGYLLQYSRASLMAQLIKNLPAEWETWLPSLGWEDPLEEGMATSGSCSGCLWEDTDTVVLGGASRDSTAFGAMEDCREPARDIPLVTNVMRKESRHTQRRDRASGSSPVYSWASTPKNQSLPFLWLCSLTSDITGDVPYHHLTLSVKELTYSSN